MQKWLPNKYDEFKIKVNFHNYYEIKQTETLKKKDNNNYLLWYNTFELKL